jgi:hypothetical protein
MIVSTTSFFYVLNYDVFTFNIFCTYTSFVIYYYYTCNEIWSYEIDVKLLIKW